MSSMLVYGDAKRREETAEKVERIRAGLSGLGDLRLGFERHAALAEQLIELGELEQALLDAQLEKEGRERWTALSSRTGKLTRLVAEALLGSFRHRGAPPSFDRVRSKGATLREALRGLRDLRGVGVPDDLDVTVPEGYAFYGLYPETYLEAAGQLRSTTDGPWRGELRVIGIRSIGTSLAALVAAAGKADVVATVRPEGHPFARTLSLSGRLARMLADGAGPETLWAIVDEGPGLSGSSFGAVADWLEEWGVRREALVFFPSHLGELGPHASELHRARWETARRCTVSFEDLFTGGASPWPLESWVEDLTGRIDAPAEDVSAGRWRERLFPAGSVKPPAHLQQERRKYLLRAAGARWLLKFAGLGRYGREKLEMSVALAAAGLAPRVAGLRHGFLVGPWLERARPLPLAPVDRRELIEQVAEYVAFRATRWPVGSEGRGASPTKLLEMAEWNAGQALGAEAGERLRAWRDQLPELEALARPVLTDNRMHAWEWLLTRDGRILKTDAVDHHAGNDLVGAQDAAWDLAGAIVELGFAGDEEARFLEAAARRGMRPTPRQLSFYKVTYLAFQMGWHLMAAQALGWAPEEAERMRRAGEGYGGRLGGLIG
ncbi:MAG TPA: hypothetical protein VKM72_31400 [Thermoanaerobaculia bacterium]|nr:hypothetical protein [Thermoanaerobaculia bacterium]